MHRAHVAALVLCCLLIPSVIVAEQEGQDMTSHEIVMAIDVQTRTISSTHTIIYYNKSGAVLEEVLLTWYPQAYASPETVPVLVPLAESYPAGFQPGGITLITCTLPYEIVDDTVLTIFLDSPLVPDSTVSFTIHYEIVIPETLNRMGYHDGIIALGNTIPIPYVFEEGIWKTYPYLSRGDPFYSECANWDLSVAIDASWTLGATGSITSEESDGDMKTYHIAARSVRDMALALSPRYVEHIVMAGDTAVRSLSLPEHGTMGRTVAEWTAAAVMLFETLFGPYPYQDLTVAAVHLGGAAGMEYPQILFIDVPYYDESNSSMLETIIVHETAHQWWYGVVGTDQVADAWLDEALVQHATLLYYETRYAGEHTPFYESYLRGVYRREQDRGLEDILHRPLDAYPSSRDQIVMAYHKGPLVLDMIRWCIGTEEYLAFLSSIYATFAFQTLTTTSLLDLMETSYPGQGVATFLDSLLTESGLPDFAADKAEWDGATLHIMPVSDIPCPCDVEVTLRDGSSVCFSNTYTLALPSGSVPVSYELDPRDVFVEADETNNVGTIPEKKTGEWNGAAIAIGVALGVAFIFAARRSSRER